MFSSDDLSQIQQHGLAIETVEEQISNYKNGFPPSALAASSLVGSGIKSIDDQEKESLCKAFEKYAKSHRVVKFVPASGAASRMFKKLFAFAESYKGGEEEYKGLVADRARGSMFDFFKNIERFAFYEDLKTAYKTSTGVDLAEAHVKREYVNIIKHLLESPGLEYGRLPKGLLKFHNYEDGPRTPVEEHLVEAGEYAICGDKEVHIHFTVSPEHQPKFENHISHIQQAYEERYGISIQVSYSTQKPSTDTIAVDLENEPYREEDGRLLFRPAGHGALLENLNDIDADVVFLKNIDNVVPDHLKPETVVNKKVIGGILVAVQEKVFSYIDRLESDFNDLLLEEIREFAEKDLGVKVSSKADREELISILNRPIRICGMVKSEGDPGGGPFWVKAKGLTSLQIVETAQIDLSDEAQRSVFNQATHFNPVDLVCGVKDYRGKKFDLMRFRDASAGFVTEKSKGGKSLKAQELPGLWNGSMANWNTVFVEVPLITFNPVKEVTDLLKPEHQ